jgi:hypothetical protein
MCFSTKRLAGAHCLMHGKEPIKPLLISASVYISKVAAVDLLDWRTKTSGMCIDSLSTVSEEMIRATRCKERNPL